MNYCLENEWMRLECQEEGGEIVHFFDKENNQECMYQGDQGWSGKNPTLFPLVGNTYTKTYQIHDKTYAMKNHGLIRYATLNGRQEDESLIFSLDSNEETKAQYPFDFHYEIQYRLEGKKLHITYKIVNMSDEAMPFNFGLHPGFIVPQKEGEKFEDYILEFEKEEHAKQLIFDVKFEKHVEYKDVTFKNWPLSYQEIDQYATIIYKDLQSSMVTLSYKGQPRLRVSIDGYPYLALWTHESHSDFLCIEPWYGHGDFEKETPDFYHREGTMILEPKQEFTTTYWIESV